MDGNISSGNIAPCSSYGGLLDFQGHGHLHQQHHLLGLLQSRNFHPTSMVQTTVPSVLNHSMENKNNCNQPQPVLIADYSKPEKGKPSISDEDDTTEGGLDELKEGPEDSKASPWQRMKWTDSMVRLLITIVSYLGEDAQCEGGHGKRRKIPVLQKKGKWKLVSEVMARRGCYVSPQQCEDKFNDLNKRYKRLVDVLGRGTSCKVVENPSLLDYMDHLSEKAKVDVRKILSSKHLFYEEMCSYHNGKRLHLPPDPDLQKLLQWVLKNRIGHETKRGLEGDMDEEELAADGEERNAETRDSSRCMSGMSGFPKKIKPCQDHLEQQQFYNSLNSPNCAGKVFPQIGASDMNCSFPTGIKADSRHDLWMKSRSIQLAEQKLHSEAQMLELEEQRIKWQRISKKKDKELEKIRLENVKMRLGNERLAFELKQLEVELKTIR